MSWDELTAAEAMKTQFWDYWQTQAASLSVMPTILWEGSNSNPAPDPNTPYLVFALRTSNRSQTTFGVPGERRYTTLGRIFIQVFCPVTMAEGLTFLTKASMIAKDAFEGKSVNSLWFRDAVVKEIGVNDGWNQNNVIVSFEYDTVK